MQPPANGSSSPVRGLSMTTLCSLALLLLTLTPIAVQSTTIPCGTPTREQAHNDALAALALNCVNVTSCPEGGDCAMAVKALTDYYTDCEVAEDDEFEALKHAGCHCIGHTGHAQALLTIDHEHFQEHHEEEHEHDEHDEEEHEHDEHDDDEDEHDEHDDDEDEEESSSRPWGATMGAAAVVNLVTLVGLMLFVPVIARSIDMFPHHYEVVGTSFAGGAMLATAVFLLLYESNHLIPINSTQTESKAAAIWGCMVLLGFMVSSIVDLGAHGVRILRAAHEKECVVCTDEEGAPCKEDMDKALATNEVDTARRQRVLASVLVGDSMHNFCDGVFIATAFVTCDAFMGWSVATAAVFHELAQEISDYVVLTSPSQANLKSHQALLLNFLSGTSVMLGALLVLAVDVIRGQVTGMLLAFGGGVYLQIGGVECMAKMQPKCTSFQLRAVSLLSFIVGAIAIGLVLLDHEHCSADEGEAGHDEAGHKHF